jgi:hypothetical protein
MTKEERPGVVGDPGSQGRLLVSTVMVLLFGHDIQLGRGLLRFLGCR